MPIKYKYSSLEDFLISRPATVDGELDDGWGAPFPVKGREIDATILFADIPGFTARTEHLTSTETLAFVNNFFSWISAEALLDRPCLIDKYIGDEIMVVFSNEFGGENAFVEAIQAARWMGEHDVLDFQPQIGLASGRVTVGYVGTPLRYGCSVFGRPVAIAARCAKVGSEDDGEFTSRIVFPAADWGALDFTQVFPPGQVRLPDGTLKDRPMPWRKHEPRTVDVKNVGSLEIIEVGNPMRRLNSFTAEERVKEGIEILRKQGRYRPAE